MGKSPAKWIKSVLLGKKSTKSGSTNVNESAAINNGYSAGEELAFSENSPVISEPVLVNTHKNGAVSANGKAEHSNLPSDRAGQQDVQNQSIVESKTSGPGQLGEEQAAVKAQAAFRGYLARRSFRALKGIIRLQALIRGHLVRRQAVSTLRTTWLIVKFQALVRGRNVRLFSSDMQFNLKFGQHKYRGAKSSDAWKEKLSSNAYLRKLLSSPIKLEPLHFQYDKRDPNSTYNWLERWTISCIWKPVSQPKRVVDGKQQVRKASYAMETESAKLKRNVRKCSAVTVESLHTSMTVESEKHTRNPRKFSSSPADSVPDSQLSELEKVKRSLRKVTNSMAEASKLSSSRADSSKVSDSIADAQKVSNPVAEISKIPSLVNGISDHRDIQCEKALQNTHEASFPLETQKCSDNGHLLEYSNIENFDLVPGLKNDQETLLDLVSIGENVDESTVVAPAVEVRPLQNIDNEDNVLREKEEARFKEERLSNGSLRTSKRKSSFSNKSEYMENGTHTTPVQPRQPSYMAATESAKAKLRGQNSPRLDSDSSAEKSGFTHRHSLPSSTNSKFELTLSKVVAGMV
ncbi:protein IQ-DOMAIN 31-like isoform X2 [Phragmites australis]|uniref:protein IQ-DOMAIN 31-like isoform X2 n=1 Tax=Phragmites australis TaxID=29695 RepID=UPI002D780D1F|nr:protein IQ-DOMAIN 31-like isoform X2 [Phragmites australis]